MTATVPIDIAPDEDEVQYPEGGLEAWLVVFGSWCAMVPSMGLLNTLAVLHAQISDHELKGLPASTIGWILSVYAFFLYLGGAQVGPIFDAYDIKWLLVPGSIGIVLSMVFVSLSHELYQFILSFGVLGGLSASMLFNPAVSAIGHWFSARRGLATGIACTAGGIGGVLFSLMILFVAPGIGFGWSMRAIALLSLISCGLACLFLKKRLPPNKHAGAAIDLKALKEPKFAATTAAVFLIEFAVFIPYTYISSYAIHKGMDPQMAYLINVFLNAGAIPGRALPGYVGDRFGTFNTMCVAALVCTIFVLGLWLPIGSLSEPMVISFAVLYGFWSGAAISLTPVCVGQVCNTEDYGKRNGTAFSLTSIGVLVGVPIAGAVLQANGGSYHGLIILGGVVYGLAVGMFAVARGIATNWVLWARF